jgi:hypothetical protein
MSQLGQSGEIYIRDLRTVSNENDCARVLQLIPGLAFAIAGIQQRRYRSGESRRVIGDRIFPSVRKIYCDDFAGTYSERDEIFGRDSNQVSKFSIGDAPSGANA